jgi:hypothetical protein
MLYPSRGVAYSRLMTSPRHRTATVPPVRTTVWVWSRGVVAERVGLGRGERDADVPARDPVVGPLVEPVADPVDEPVPEPVAELLAEGVEGASVAESVAKSVTVSVALPDGAADNVRGVSSMTSCPTMWTAPKPTPTDTAAATAQRPNSATPPRRRRAVVVPGSEFMVIILPGASS